MFIELAVFPLFVGGLIEVVTLPFFEGASVSTLVAQMRKGPFGSLFVLWLIGTLWVASMWGSSSRCQFHVRLRKLLVVCADCE